MPRKYPDQTKHESIGIRQIHAAIPFTYYATAVYQRSLHRWRDGLRKKQNGFMSEKTFQSDIKRTQNQLLAENSAETCQQDATATNAIQTFLLGKPSETAIKLAFMTEKYIPSAETAINGNIF